MASWWKLVAESLGVTSGGRSHARRVAEHIGATDQAGRSWPAKIALAPPGVTRDQGSWAKRIVPENLLLPGAAERSIYANAGEIFGPGGTGAVLLNAAGDGGIRNAADGGYITSAGG